MPPLLRLLVVIAVLATGPTSGTAAFAGTAPATPAASPAADPGTDEPPTDPDAARHDPALLPAERAAVRAETDGRLSAYRIAATLVPADPGLPGAVEGTLDVDVLNDTAAPLAEVFLRLYANDDEYADGAMSVRDVTVDGAPVEPVLEVAETVVRVPLPAPLPPERRVTLALAFSAVIPVDPDGSYNIFSVQPGRGTWALAHWYPVLAGRNADGTLNLDPPSDFTDPVFTNTARYDVALTAPSDWVLVATGVETGADEDPVTGQTTHRYVSGPVRDFTVVADDDFLVVSTDVDGTRVTSYFNPGSETDADNVLTYGARALALFNQQFGAYPYAELDLVQVGLRNAGGVEWPQLIFIEAGYYGNAELDPEARWLENVVAHEVAHQWWYALVGSNQYRHAFIDEGLTNYSTILYFDETYGLREGRRQLERYLVGPYARLLADGNDQIVDRPAAEFPGARTFVTAIYSKSALGFWAIRREIGRATFYDALRAYAAEHRFGVATPPDLRAALEDAAGRDLDDLWRRWFEEARGAEDIEPGG